MAFFRTVKGTYWGFGVRGSVAGRELATLEPRRGFMPTLVQLPFLEFNLTLIQDQVS